MRTGGFLTSLEEGHYSPTPWRLKNLRFWRHQTLLVSLVIFFIQMIIFQTIRFTSNFEKNLEWWIKQSKISAEVNVLLNLLAYI
jgi:hypothetical protein